MDLSNGGRKKHVTDNGKGVNIGKESQGTGPVGRADGYQGRKEQYNASGSGRAGGSGQRSGGGKSPLLLIIGAIVLLLFGGGGGLSLLNGGSGSGSGSGSSSGSSGSTSSGSSNYSSQSGSYSGSQSASSGSSFTLEDLLSGMTGGSYSGSQSSSSYDSSSASSLGSEFSGLFEMLTGFTGNNSVSDGWGSTVEESSSGNEVITVPTTADELTGGQSSSASSGSIGSTSSQSGSLAQSESQTSQSSSSQASSSGDDADFVYKPSSNNTGRLNTSVAKGARAKRTKILGNGKDTVTIMVYMCGTDLESRSGMASNDLAEMAQATASDKVNILIYTGGCRSWKINGISSQVNQVYKITDGRLQRIIESDGTKSMVDPSTLSGFIKWCAKNYPANRMDLIFWDHGGGSLSGYGYDEKNPRSGSMSLTGIDKALSDAGVTFDFIGFDTCLMGTLETALVCADYADYLIGSEETEPGIGWYYTNWLSSLAKNTSQDTLETGKNIVDGFVDMCARQCRGQLATLALIDLAELEKTVPDKLSAFSSSTGEMIRGSNYKRISNARAGAREFAVSNRIDQVDLVNFADNIGTKAASDLRDVLLSAIKYNRTSTNMTNAYGLSIYFPYRSTMKVDSASRIYKEIGLDSAYSDCIKSFAGLETTGQLASGGSTSPFESLFGGSFGSYGSGGSGYGSSSGGYSGSDILTELLMGYLSGGRSIGGMDSADTKFMSEEGVLDPREAAAYVDANHFHPENMYWTEDEQGRHLMTLPDEDWDLIQNLQMNMFYDTGEGFVDLGLDNIYEFTPNGRLIGDSDGTWLSIDGQPVAFYYEGTTIEDGKETIIGRVPVRLNGYRANLILVFDDENPDGRIAGARYDYVDGETETAAKNTLPLEEGDEIVFLCDIYSYNEDYLDSRTLGEPLIYRDGLEISNTYVGDNTRVTYLLTDIYDQEYWTPVVPN